MSRLGWALFMLYLATLAYYLYVRVTSTLNLGLHYQWHALAQWCIRICLCAVCEAWLMCFKHVALANVELGVRGVAAFCC